jgi:hypothetical protein
MSVIVAAVEPEPVHEDYHLRHVTHWPGAVVSIAAPSHLSLMAPHFGLKGCGNATTYEAAFAIQS